VSVAPAAAPDPDSPSIFGAATLIEGMVTGGATISF
jgi:hypothetical protein